MTAAGETPDPAAREALRENLHEIALRGESGGWKDWERLQLVKMDGGRWSPYACVGRRD